MDDPEEDCEKVVKKDKCDSKGDKCMMSCGLCGDTTVTGDTTTVADTTTEGTTGGDTTTGGKMFGSQGVMFLYDRISINMHHYFC